MIPDNYFKTEYGTSYLEKVVLPSSLKTIGTSAFYGCKNLTSVIIPEGVTKIASDAFANCSSKLVLTVTEGSYAQEWAQIP